MDNILSFVVNRPIQWWNIITKFKSTLKSHAVYLTKASSA